MSSIEKLVKDRFKLGLEKYGHGVRVAMDTMTWGTAKNSWMEMAQEEFLDGIIYTIADYIKEKNITGDWTEEDDNELILKVLNTKMYLDSPKHSNIIGKLLECVQESS